MDALLPDDVWKIRRASFDNIAALYDAARPTYPAEIFLVMESRLGAGGAARILEIGCGTGQATRDLAERGHTVHAVEPGTNLAKLARENLAAFPQVTIEETTFEAAAFEPEAYDVVFAAFAWHWVDASIGYPKAAEALRPGGLLTLVSNGYARGGTQQLIAEDVRAIYAREAPEMMPRIPPTLDDIRATVEGPGDMAALWQRVDRQTSDRKLKEPPDVSALFAPPEIFLCPWMATMDSGTYVDLIATGSTYLQRVPDGRRNRVLEAIVDLIDDKLGGTVTKEFVAVMATAARR